MDVRINEVQSNVQVGSSQTALDSRVMRELVRACVKAVKEEQEREKRLEKERRLNSKNLPRRARGGKNGETAESHILRSECGRVPSKQPIPVRFNPTEYTLNKGAQIAELTIPGLDSPILQFVRGQTETLSLDLFFDSTESGMDDDATSVTTLTDPFYQLVKIDGKTHAPPICFFSWGSEFPGQSAYSSMGGEPEVSSATASSASSKACASALPCSVHKEFRCARRSRSRSRNTKLLPSKSRRSISSPRIIPKRM